MMPETITFQSLYSIFLRERILQNKIITATFIYFHREILYTHKKKRNLHTSCIKQTSKSQQEEESFERTHYYHKTPTTLPSRSVAGFSPPLQKTWCGCCSEGQAELHTSVIRQGNEFGCLAGMSEWYWHYS